jgi:hypothetical protein
MAFNQLEGITLMLRRLARRKWKLTAALAVGLSAISGVALAYAYTVVYGTSGNDTINESFRTETARWRRT